MSDLFTDSELDAFELAYKTAECDHFDALKHQINLLTNRVSELQRSFRHYHQYNPEAGDSCIKCGMDLRDPIHIRAGERDDE